MIAARALRMRLGRVRMTRSFADWGAMREAFDSAPPAGKASAAPTPVAKAPASASVSSGTSPAASASNGAVAMKDYFKGGDLGDSPPGALDESLNWSSSFHGLGNAAFAKEAQEILASEIEANDVEITPDGLLYLPEIKYRRILNRAFGAGGWGLAPRSETLISKQGLGGQLTREYALVVNGRLVSIARGEQQFFADKGIPTATEGCKSNALMRCCKDLGIASELWDPRFIRTFKRKYCEDIFVEHVPTKKKKKIWKRKDETVEYPFKQ